ncbi:ribonuclease HII [Cellulomonas sp. Sa3CUA2]|uniref:Ribonuclease n=1 Tax=Cellulomonas avistercoris TaxID=2762242 RepID=A0ABR8QEP0_9CELL|nr:ribonuclease HII [Cellulomonas avistercoris]MBD7918893.1 ribonuclease HII [Cellulomonas avistercoris]
MTTAGTETAARASGRTVRRAPRPAPHLRHERALLRTGLRYVAGMDEVGRGSLAGPVSVGVVVVDVATRSAPRGVADSKLLSPAARQALLPSLGRWGVARAVGHASPDEIDERGIIAALRLAGTRALREVLTVVEHVDAVVLDGSHDWLTPPQPDLFGTQDELFDPPRDVPVPVVHLRVKADRSCASVAAASVLAKCERDALMVRHAALHPEYRWEDNKGYAAPEHVAALREHGPSPLHRRSWRLPTLQEPPVPSSGHGWATDPLLPDPGPHGPS